MVDDLGKSSTSPISEEIIKCLTFTHFLRNKRVKWGINYVQLSNVLWSNVTTRGIAINMRRVNAGLDLN